MSCSTALLLLVAIPMLDWAAAQVAEPLLSRVCEKTNPDGERLYFACLSEPLTLLTNTFYNMSVTPGMTCGESGQQEPFCTLGIRDCEYCDATDDALKHPKEYMVDSNDTTSWQSKTWSDYPTPLAVNITLHFGKLYELQDDLILTFQSSRPQEMILERSVDFGATWEAWQYYDKSCKNYYNQSIASSVPKSNPNTVICSQDYSGELPYQDGQVRFPVVADRYALFLGESLTDYDQLFEAFNSTNINAFLSFTSLRIRLLYPATDGKETLRKEKDLIRYYYAISEIAIIGGCSCNLHASYCLQENEETVCNCQHNTYGKNCEHCLPLFNNRPWKPGFYVPYPTGTPNPCQQCTCNDHADSCEYDADEQRGICIDCYHNTTGDFCGKCIPGFYQNSSLPLNHQEVCSECDCELLGVLNNITDCAEVDGLCTCKNNVEGRRCDICRDQYYGLLLMDDDPGTCKVCACNMDGTVGQSNVCEKQAGQCPCKPRTTTRDCSECGDGYYRFPLGRPDQDCLDCECNPGGAMTLTCDKGNGVCSCHDYITGQKCSIVTMGYYVPALDVVQLQPKKLMSDTCEEDTALVSPENLFTGITFYRCSEGQRASFEDLAGNLQQPSLDWPYYITVRYSLPGNVTWQSTTVQLRVEGNSNVNISHYVDTTDQIIDKACPYAPGQAYAYPMSDLETGIGLAWMAPEPTLLDARCRYSASADAGTSGGATNQLVLDSIVLIPDYNSSKFYKAADANNQQDFVNCVQRISALSTRTAALDDLTCRDFIFGTTSELSRGGLACDCDSVGTVTGTVCQSIGGACSCKPGVTGRRCDACEPGYYEFSEEGCKPCNCDGLGSTNLVCNYTSGQCPCRSNVAPAGVENAFDLENDLQCRSCAKDFYGFSTGEGCKECGCNAAGRNTTQCMDTGQCICKETINGEKCEICEPGYYDFSTDGCTPCNCSRAGSNSIECHATSGQCTCRSINVQGQRCDLCADNSFNLQESNPEGCQRCFCYGHGTQCTSATGFTKLVISDSSTETWPDSDPLNTGRSDFIQAPAKFLGDRHYAYGQVLTFSVRALGPDVNTTTFPLVVLTGRVEGTEKIASYSGPDYKITDVYATISLRLHHTYWSFEGNVMDFFNFYAMLADLTGFYLRRTVDGTSLIYNSAVTMVTAEEAGPGDETVQYVEDCTCEVDRNVRGLSCEMCSQGYQRPPPDGTLYTPCVECDCNRRGITLTEPVECDEVTGECLNCPNGTTGLNCQDCAPNVGGAKCDTCDDEYWGLGRDGCRECNCSMPGSEDPICNKITGQCDCGAESRNVIGEKCDQCRDNFHNLTESGCEECDECYQLVEAEVDDLREMRDNLTSLVTFLKAQDNTTELGPFHRRLEDTTRSMETLLQFLTEATEVQGTVGPQVARLNSTLNYLKQQVNVDAIASIDQSNSSILNAKDLLTQGQGVIEDTKETVVDADREVSGTIAGYIRTLEALAADLKSVEETLGDVSNTALSDVIRIGQSVKTIETNSERAKTLAEGALQDVEGAQSDHQDTTERATDLQNFLDIVMSTNAEVSMATAYASGNASATLQRAVELDRNVTNLGLIEEDMNILREQAGALKGRSEELTDKVAEATVDAQPTIDRVQDAASDTQPLLAEVSDLETQAEGLQGRIEAASQEAGEAATLEAQTFSQAEETLEVMRNFEDMAEAVEDEATESLSTVQSVKQLSEEAITNSEALTEALQVADMNSQQAKTLAEEAKTQATANNQAMQQVVPKAEKLKEQSDSSLNDVDGKVNDVLRTNQTRINPSKMSCDRLDLDVQGLESKAETASNKSKQVSADIEAARTRVNEILDAFQNVNNVNQEEIDELKRLMTLTRQEFERRKLTTAVENAKKRVEDQRAWLEDKKKRKVELEAEIRRLKDLREQLRP